VRAYLAIIKDSFREALASRVLWILLVLTTLLLLALAPMGLDEQVSVKFTPREILDGPTFIERIERQQAASPPSPGKQVWKLLGADFKVQLERERDSRQDAAAFTSIDVLLPKELNKLLDRRELYDPRAWDKVRLSEEAQALAKRGVERLSDDEVSRFNRLLLKAAYPGLLARSRDPAVHFSYFGMRLGDALPLKKKLLVDGVISAFMNLFVGVIGVFTAVLVTASIMPQTFAPGAIDLLLSKPISRSLLYLTKFVGGCMFTLINGAYVIVGLWLIAGLRFGLWSNKLLLCIPVFMFLFAIYYAVSALAGAIWRNPIVSVVMTILFWGLCFSVGSAKNVIELVFLNPQRLVKLVPAGKELFAANERGEAFRWSEAERAWLPVLAFGERDEAAAPFGMAAPLIGPVYDPRHERLIALPSPLAQFGMVPNGNLLRIGERAEDWQRLDGVAAPAGTAALFVDPRGRLLAVTSGGVFRLQGEASEKQRRVNVFGFELPAGAAGSQFVAASPPLRLRSPLAAAMDPQTGELAIFDSQRLLVLALDKADRYRARVERKLEKQQAGVVAFAGQTMLLGLADGWAIVLDAADLKRRDEFRPGGADSPRFIQASPDGRYFAVLLHTRKLYLYDARQRQMAAAAVSGQGDISAVAMPASDRLLAADQFARVTQYRLPEMAVERREAPSRGALERAYVFVIKPIYTIFPKPGELDNLVSYLLTEQQSVSTRADTEDLQAGRIALNIWGPVWSNLAFVAIAVCLGCWYTARKDF
jgi:ABC-type transport system involved in multi-copper enzyme maturation permease subunit